VGADNGVGSFTGIGCFCTDEDWGRAREAVEERVGMACEEDTTAGSDVPLMTGFTPFATRLCNLGSDELGVERLVGVIFPCREYGLDIDVAGRFCISASVD